MFIYKYYDVSGGHLPKTTTREEEVHYKTRQDMASEIHDSTGDIDGGTQSPSNHGHRDDDDTIKDRRLCSARQKDDKDVTQTKDVQTKDVTQRNSLKDGLSNIPQQQCEEQNKPSDAVSITVTQDSQGISEILGMIASSQNKRGSTIVYPEVNTDSRMATILI
ncbi:uncharacterized protein LOC117314980 isoform X2 [Pecten maximus]|uniref:uncharacterized protein LOC117314980 isoform X2 n=1 Tax=Pecten maximus TaxID=6579 RepID=UPI001458E641|nr:uncharacterized protein LOC117314980 isoform X2 [Pecten maximus]